MNKKEKIMNEKVTLKISNEIFEIYLNNKCSMDFVKHFLTSGDIEVDKIFNV